MQGPTKALSPQRGFSLLELIVVIAMMAVLTGVIVPRLNLGGEGRLVRDETLRLAELMSRATEESVFKTRQLGVRFTDRKYHFLLLDGDGREGKWVDHEDKLFRTREWPQDFDVRLEIAGVTVELDDSELFEIDDKTRPHIMFLSNGEVMPDFKVVVEKGFNDERWEVASGVEELITVGKAEDF
jgi:general secretion pathway protein H